MLKSVQLGNSGLMVSQLCLGTMNPGVPGQGHQGDRTLGADFYGSVCVEASLSHKPDDR